MAGPKRVYDEELIVKLYQEGMSKENIGREIKASCNTIAKILSKNGVGNTKTAKDHLEEKREEIVKQYKSGIGSDSLAKIYNCSASAMLRFLQKNTEVKRNTETIDLLRLNKQKIIDDYNAGESNYKLAKDYNTQDAMIYLFLRDECGVKMRGTV